jgi:membrane protease YdiL (CAAX protease family)
LNAGGAALRDETGAAGLTRPARWDLLDGAAVVCLDAGALGLGAWVANAAGLPRGAGPFGALARCAIVLPAVMILARRVWKTELAELGLRLPDAASWRWSARFVAGVGAAYLVLGLLLVAAFRGHVDAAAVSRGARAHLASTDLAGWCFRAFLAAPVVEEIVFRGVLYRSLRARMPAAAAVASSAAAFAGMHLVWSWTLFVPYTQILGGIVFAWAYERTRSLVLPAVLHLAGNVAILAAQLIAAGHPGLVARLLG